MLKTFQAENFPKLISRFLVISSKSSKTSPKQNKYIHNNNNTKNENKLYLGMGFPRGSVVEKKKKKSCLQCRRHGFNPWVRKILWRKNWQTLPVFLPGKSRGQRSLAGYSTQGCKESDTT